MIASGIHTTRPRDWASVPKGANGTEVLDAPARDFYRAVIGLLQRERVPFLIGGAYAFATYTGVVRHTKDLDIFVKPQDCEAVLAACASAGWKTELTFRHWLAKVYSESDHLVDVIFSSGNGICEVDEGWFRHAIPAAVLDAHVKLIPCEEMIWSKGYILERNRYDGADIAHLLRAQGPRLDWPRLLTRFGPHWRLLLSHMVLFGFVYPCEQDRIPRGVMDEMLARLRREQQARPPSNDRICRGTLLSHTHFNKDVSDWGYGDARLPPHGNMTAEDLRQWTSAFK